MHCNLNLNCDCQEYLEENSEVTFDVFIEKVWDNIHQIYRKPGDASQSASEDVPPAANDVSFCNCS